MIKACIFDLDGVLVDTAHYHFLAWKRLAAEEFNFELTEDANEKLKGVSRIHSLEIILDLAGIKLSSARIEELSSRKNDWFNELISKMKADEIFPGVKALLETLRSENIKIGLASSSKNAQAVIDLLGIRTFFDAVVDGTMIENTKPHPEIFLLAAQKLQTPVEQCLVFEDAEAGVEAAIRAGMKCIGIGSPGKLKKALLVIKGVHEFDNKMIHNL